MRQKTKKLTRKEKLATLVQLLNTKVKPRRKGSKLKELYTLVDIPLLLETLELQ